MLAELDDAAGLQRLEGGELEAHAGRLRPAADAVVADVEVTLEVREETLFLDVCNDGVGGRPKTTGMGRKLAALAALLAGGLVEFGERENGTWRVRMAVPV